MPYVFNRLVPRRCRDGLAVGLRTLAGSASRFGVVIVSISILVALLLSAPEVSGQDVSLDNQLERAASLIRDNRIADAERELVAILRRSPKEAVALNLLGTIRAKQGRLEDAESLFTRSVRIDPKLVGAHMNLAYLYLLKGSHDKTASELKTVLELEPRNTDASYKLAWLLLSQNKLDDCVSVITAARQSQPPSAQLLALLGDAYSRKGDLQKAEESYLLALKENDRDPGALLGLAKVYQSKSDVRTTMLYLSRAKSLINDSPELLYKYSVIAVDAQLGNDAIIALKRAIELRPKEWSYYFALGIVWLTKPDLQEAEQSFRESLKLRPENAEAQTYLGYTLLKEKSYSEAREWFEKSIKSAAATPEIFYYLGVIAQEQKEDERAVELFEKSIQLSPSFAHPHISLGAAYLKMKNYPRAQQELEIGAKLSPEDSKVHYNLALLYSRLNDSKRAQEEMQIVEKLKSSNGPSSETDLVTPPRPRPR